LAASIYAGSLDVSVAQGARNRSGEKPMPRGRAPTGTTCATWARMATSDHIDGPTFSGADEHRPAVRALRIRDIGVLAARCGGLFCWSAYRPEGDDVRFFHRCGNPAAVGRGLRPRATRRATITPAGLRATTSIITSWICSAEGRSHT
jgi:hypothetical protein